MINFQTVSCFDLIRRFEYTMMMLIQDIFQNRESKWWWKPNEYRFLGKTRNKIKRYIFKFLSLR
ncbi:hypothetical protein DERP_012646 [Dermatophagoides pteronyssinus]|uniref:Uncharacterized protein n=1 Tax=Dermatophagoides pteronyssinus TaxID=6956 RepID=A0ABQ8IZ34_DERPT|nr:hypothetical protein DERP_012646 [Dermatophagoides pteronyssinus]